MVLHTLAAIVADALFPVPTSCTRIRAEAAALAASLLAHGAAQPRAAELQHSGGTASAQHDVSMTCPGRKQVPTALLACILQQIILIYTLQSGYIDLFVV